MRSRSNILIVCATAFISLQCLGKGKRNAHHNSSNSVRVKGYLNKSGKYVSPHFRTRLDESKEDNWSTKGNTNPYTGKPGTKKDE